MTTPDAFPASQPHDPPREILPDVLFVHGTMRMGPGMTINRNMVALRHGGEVTLVDPIRMDPAGEAALEAFGAVKHVVRLGKAHGVDDAYTVQRFGAKLWSLDGPQDHPEPKPDATLTEGGPLPIPDAELFVFRGAQNWPEAALLLHRHDGLLLTCDSIQHWESGSRSSPLARVFMKLTGFMHHANIGPFWRKGATPKDGSLRPDFDRLLALRFENLIGAHGQPLLGGAHDKLAATVRRVYRD